MQNKDETGGILIKLSAVTKIYPMGETNVTAVDGVDLDIHRGEFLSIVGSSGSGKSTLLNLIGGLDQPSSGTVSFCGKDIGKMKDRELTMYRRSEVGFIFQFYNLLEDLTAYENVAFTADLAGNSAAAGKALEAVGLHDRASHFPSQLSGGEQQRVAIARAIAKNPELILCDEPLGALDYQTGKQILTYLEYLVREKNHTLVMVTHNAPTARIADRIIRMKSGRIIDEYINTSPLSASEVEW